MIDRSKAPRSVRIGIIYPNSVAWLEGHRRISCIVRDTRRGLKGLVAPAWRGSQTAPFAPRNPGYVGLTGRSHREALLCR